MLTEGCLTIQNRDNHQPFTGIDYPYASQSTVYMRTVTGL